MPDEPWTHWLNRWLKAHPVKEPPAAPGSGYTQEVMRRIRSEPRSAFLPAWLTFPRVSFGLGAALACGLAVLLLGQGPELARLDLERELQESDRIVLAEADEFIEGLEDEEPLAVEEDQVTEEEILQELEALDEQELIG